MNRYSIKIVSEITGFPESTLRYYEKVGLWGYISGKLNGLRMYVDVHLEKLNNIKYFKDCGMLLREIQQFYQYEENIENNIEDILQLVMISENKLRVQSTTMQEQLRHVHGKVQYYHGIKHAVSNHEKWKKYEDYA